jgi:DUF4097 and DUF4098 domain-containing protein YvlB
MAGADAVLEPMEVLIAATNERIRVVAEKRADVEVDGDARFDQNRTALTIEATGDRLTVRVPEGTEVVIGTTSARVEVEGEVGRVAITTESGRISVEVAESVDARTINGRVELGRISGDCRVRSKNGRVNIRSCAAPDVATVNGAINLDAVDGTARAHCVNGRINIKMMSAHNVSAETVGGRIDISLPPGVRALQRGKATANPVARDGFDCVIDARSSTGRVSISER